MTTTLRAITVIEIFYHTYSELSNKLTIKIIAKLSFSRSVSNA